MSVHPLVVVFGGGYPGKMHILRIDYVQIMTTGNAVDFGDLLKIWTIQDLQMVMEVYNV